MIRHTVMWKLAAADPQQRLADAQRIKEGLEGLRGLPGILRLEVGIDDALVEGNWHAVLLADYVDQAALDAYQVHPEHVRVAEFIGTVRETRAAVDFAVPDLVVADGPADS
jgi:quinol monooxygenase YgiN